MYNSFFVLPFMAFSHSFISTKIMCSINQFFCLSTNRPTKSLSSCVSNHNVQQGSLVPSSSRRDAQEEVHGCYVIYLCLYNILLKFTYVSFVFFKAQSCEKIRIHIAF